MRLFFVFLALLSPAAALAAPEVALMVNMNYSSKEWEAFQKSAAACGKYVAIVPPEEMIPLGEAVFSQRDDLYDKILKDHSDWPKLKIDNMISDIMRHGLNWNGDKGVRSKYAAEIDALHQNAMALSQTEKKFGSIESQLKEKAAALEKAGYHVSTVAFSSHSDGWNLTGESTNRLSWSGVSSVVGSTPRLFDGTRHVLLLGCYSMTDENRSHWRSLFPHASLMAGFGIQAPKRTRPYAWQFVSETLDTACELDEKLAANGKALQPKLVEKVFKDLPAVANTNSVVDYCYQIVEGQPNSTKLTCDEQWENLMRQAGKIQGEYMDLGEIKKDPPVQDDPASELRVFYKVLQTTCPAKDSPVYVGADRDRASYYRTSMKESTIRLIFWWQVQKNFHTYYGQDIPRVNHELASLGIRDRAPSLDGTTGRKEFVQWYNKVRDQLTANRPRANPREEAAVNSTYQQFEQLYYSLFSLRGDHTVNEGAVIDEATTLEKGGIPFNWVEPGAVLTRRNQ